MHFHSDCSLCLTQRAVKSDDEDEDPMVKKVLKQEMVPPSKQGLPRLQSRTVENEEVKDRTDVDVKVM